jgi:D-xylose transport system substrate-binding protein
VKKNYREMSWRRRVLTLVAAAPLLVGLAACSTGGGAGEGTSDGADPTIAWLAPQSDSARWIVIDTPQFKESLQKLCSGCTLIQQNADYKVEEQQAQVEAAIAQDAKAIVIAAVDGSALTGVVNNAASKDIAVISYDNLIVDAPIDYEITFDNVRVGEMMAQSLVDRMEEQGTQDKCVVVIQGDAKDTNGKIFWSGSEPVFEEEGMDICYNENAEGWSPPNAQTLMDQAITEVGAENIGGVYVMNDGMAGGVVAALKGAGVTELPPITGQDGVVDAIQRILVGDQYMTVWKNSLELADAAADIAYQFASGETPEGATTVENGYGEIPATLLDPVVVTKDNIQETVIDSGFISVEDLCAGQYADACEDAGIS